MVKRQIALVSGDGSAPEMMVQATKVACAAAQKDGIEIEFVPTPMGWNAYRQYGDTLPNESLQTATRLGLLFFGGVGDPEYDSTIGKEYPKMMPEARVLLTIRKQWGLLLNFRPVIFYKSLAHLAMVRPETIPAEGVEQHWIRFLLEDEYYGNRDLAAEFEVDVRHRFGIKFKHEVTGEESVVLDLAYYRRETLEKYFRAAFRYARQIGTRLICVDKANILPRYVFWRKTCERIGREEFPDVPLIFQYVDSANMLLYTPAELHGVIACGNAHGDILSDGASGAVGSLGLMHSSAVNPDTGWAMFESGAGTAPTLADKDVANPLGRILAAAMMLRHIGAEKGALAIEIAVRCILEEGWRTADLVSQDDDPQKIVGTVKMGELVLSRL